MTPTPWTTIDADSALAEIEDLARRLRRNPPPATEEAFGVSLHIAIWDIRGALRALRHTARHLKENQQ